MKQHKSFTVSRIVAAVEESQRTLDNPGFCIYCGEEADGCEPDARRYPCDSCNRPGVFGAEELLLMVQG